MAYSNHFAVYTRTQNIKFLQQFLPKMVVPIQIKNKHEINFLKNHPLGPKLGLADIGDYLKMSEMDVDAALEACDPNDYGGSAQEVVWIQNHPLGPQFTDECISSVKIALYIVYNFFVILAIRICDQLPLLQQVFHVVAKYYLKIVDYVSEHVSDSYIDDMQYEIYNMDSTDYYNITNDTTINESAYSSATNDSWITADLNVQPDDGSFYDEINVWKKDFLDIFPIPDIVNELYDDSMTVEKHQMNMILGSLEAHLAGDNYQIVTSESVLTIRAKHYRQSFEKVFPVTVDDFLLNMVYTSELTLDRHIDMMKLAIRTKYAAHGL